MEFGNELILDFSAFRVSAMAFRFRDKIALAFIFSLSLPLFSHSDAVAVVNYCSSIFMCTTAHSFFFAFYEHKSVSK